MVVEMVVCRVEGASQHRKNIWLICQVMSSSVSSSSVGVVAGRSTWGTGSVGAIVEDRRAVTWDSLSRFISKIDETIAMIEDC